MKDTFFLIKYHSQDILPKQTWAPCHLNILSQLMSIETKGEEV